MAKKTYEALEESGKEKNAEMAKEFTAVTPETWGASEMGSPSGKVHKDYPSFRLRLKDIPEAKDWEVGKCYSIEVLVKQISRVETDNRDEVGFDVLGIKAGKELTGDEIPEDIDYEEGGDDDEDEEDEDED